MAEKKNYGTLNGEPLTDERIEQLVAVCERDWDENEVEVRTTNHGKALLALQNLDLPTEEITALERRAKNAHKPLPFFLRSLLRDELAS